MTTLVHICCGPCATATIEHWREAGADAAGFFFNPNIHPLLEFRRRLTGARDLSSASEMELREDLTYDPAAWFARVGVLGEDRCSACIGWRLERTAAEAARGRFDSFSTSLAISPWQDHEAIEQQGRRAGELHGVEFLYRDLRPLYRRSRELARREGLYRQKYCGCVLSEWERYREP